LLRSQQIVSDKGTDYSARWTGFLQPTTCEELMLTYDVCEGGAVWFDKHLVIDGA
jgi:hypothetical protein